MALNEDQKTRLKLMITQLEHGEIASTDASRITAEFLFESDRFAPTDQKDIWRAYDEAMAKATIEMIRQLTK